MDIIDIAKLFDSTDGVKSLSQTCVSFGIRFSTDTKTFLPCDVINFGLIEKESLQQQQHPKHFGYESTPSEAVHKPIKSFSKECFITYAQTQGRSYFRIVSCEFWPRNNPDEPVLKLELLSPQCLELNPGTNTPFTVAFEIAENFEGSIARWVIFELDGIEKPSLACVKQVKLLMGIQILGSVVSRRIKNLSTDAKAFVPSRLLNTFDYHVSNLYTYSWHLIYSFKVANCVTIIYFWKP
jgi:hypothetical protein